MVAESFSLSVLLCSQAPDIRHIYQIKIFREAPSCVMSGSSSVLLLIFKPQFLSFRILRLRELNGIWGPGVHIFDARELILTKFSQSKLCKNPILG